MYILHKYVITGSPYLTVLTQPCPGQLAYHIPKESRDRPVPLQSTRRIKKIRLASHSFPPYGHPYDLDRLVSIRAANAVLRER